MLRKDVDTVEKTTVVEKDRAGARMGGCCQLVSRWTGHGPTLGSNATACGCGCANADARLLHSVMDLGRAVLAPYVEVQC